MNDERYKLEMKVADIWSNITNILIKKEMTITSMESITSGFLASLITDTSGASAIFKGSFVTYCNEAKIMQGASADIIDKYSVYSEQTALSMAHASIKAYKADIGIGVTGTAGNIDPLNSKDSEPGKVYYAIVLKETIHLKTLTLDVMPDRHSYKLAIACEIGNDLLTLLELK